MKASPSPSKFKLSLVAALAVLSVTAFGPSANAALLVYESFDYTTGSLNGQNGGTGFSGAWTASNVSVQDDSLVYPTLATAGDKVYASPVGASATAARNLTSSFSTGTIYTSFLVNLDEGTRFLGLSLTQGGTETAFVGRNSGAGSLSWAATAGGGTGASGITTTLDTTFLLVLRIDFNASGANERIRLYVNPTSDVEPIAANVDFTTTSSFQFDGIRLSSGLAGGGNTTSTGWFDEVRLGTTFADVTPVPEPTTMALGIVGLTCMTILRRRRVVSQNV